MRKTFGVATVAAAIVTACWFSSAQATFFGYPRGLKPLAERIRLDAPSLAPIGHTRFCLQYPKDCEVRGMLAFRRKAVALTEELWAELVKINRGVNRAIVPQRNDRGLWGEEWLISPVAGDCNDYAVTKRHELLARGWPSQSLMLAEVVMPSREHHLVLVVRTREGDFVLDNMSPNVRGWSKTPYQWVRVQSPRNPRFWATIARANA
jgi:predicted transglutaminase-like cysteine proteinase